MDDRKKVIYISGPITGVKNYWEPFEKAEDDLTALGYIPLSPARLPQGMTNEQYMRINFALIDSADAVLFLAEDRYCSEGMELEKAYCRYIGKPRVIQRRDFYGERTPEDIEFAWLKHDLEEVFGA